MSNLVSIGVRCQLSQLLLPLALGGSNFHSKWVGIIRAMVVSSYLESVQLLLRVARRGNH